MAHFADISDKTKLTGRQKAQFKSLHNVTDPISTLVRNVQTLVGQLDSSFKSRLNYNIPSPNSIYDIDNTAFFQRDFEREKNIAKSLWHELEVLDTLCYGLIKKLNSSEIESIINDKFGNIAENVNAKYLLDVLKHCKQYGKLLKVKELAVLEKYR